MLLVTSTVQRQTWGSSSVLPAGAQRGAAVLWGEGWKVRAHRGANVPTCVHSEALPGSGVQLPPSDGFGFGSGRGRSEASVVSGQVVSCRHCLHISSHPGAGTSVLGILWSLAKGHVGDAHPQMLWLPGQSLSGSPKAGLQRKPQVQATGGDVGWEAGSGTHLRGCEGTSERPLHSLICFSD